MCEKKYQMQLARNVTTDDVNAIRYSDMLTRDVPEWDFTGLPEPEYSGFIIHRNSGSGTGTGI